MSGSRISVMFLLILTNIFCACSSNQNKGSEVSHPVTRDAVTRHSVTSQEVFDSNAKTIHIMVALCDNKYQGIVPVPAKIGNGQDPYNNLYWGTAYGIKTYFRRSNDWDLISTEKDLGSILERVVFRHVTQDYYIVADAYDGQYIKETTEDFLRSSSGMQKGVLSVDDRVIGIEGNASLIAYIGHDGLMDFKLKESFKNRDNIKRDVIVLACFSKKFFEPHLADAKVNPLVWTTGLMAPEAYTIHDAIEGFIKGESNDEIQLRAAKAYAEYQKCSLKAAQRLLVTN